VNELICDQMERLDAISMELDRAWDATPRARFGVALDQGGGFGAHDKTAILWPAICTIH
jgi:hypothetical protein